MGLCLEDFGKISIEVRRESFIIHAGYGYTGEDGDEVPTTDFDHFGKHWRDEPHPEFLLEDIDDLIKALKDAKRYLRKTRG